MCNNRYYDAISVGVSILIGVALSVLGLLGLIAANVVLPILGLAFAALCLLLLTIAAASSLRQDAQFAACLCQRGVRLLVGALLLGIVSGFALVFVITGPIFGQILTFLTCTLIAYTMFSLYCALRCLVRAGCAAEPAACVLRM